MDDKTLLELVAKAYAHPDVKYIGGPNGGWVRVIGCNEDLHCDVMVCWNPLIDDGDALRLAVTLRITPHIDGNLTDAESSLGFSTEAHFSDPYAATRRAIVRAAAAIGKVMP